MSKVILQKWLDGEYVSPQEFKDSLKAVIEQVEQADKEMDRITALGACYMDGQNNRLEVYEKALKQIAGIQWDDVMDAPKIAFKALQF